MARTFNCAICDDEYENPTRAGRPPVRCVFCDPRAWSEEARAAALKRRRELEDVERRLETLLERVGDVGAREEAAPPEPPPLIANGARARVSEQPRLALAQAVRNVGRARGNVELTGALDELAETAKHWRHVLT